MGQVGYVYIVHARGTNYIKIGKSTNPLKRLQQLQAGVPFPLCILSVTLKEDMDIAERELQNEYFPYLIRGEWYSLPDEILAQWPNDDMVAHLTDAPILKPSTAIEPFSGRTYAQIRAILSKGNTLKVSSIYAALEAHTKREQGRIRVALQRMYEANILTRDFRGFYHMANTGEESLIELDSSNKSY